MADATEILVTQHPTHETMFGAYYDRWKEIHNGRRIDNIVKILSELEAKNQHKLITHTN